MAVVSAVVWARTTGTAKSESTSAMVGRMGILGLGRMVSGGTTAPRTAAFRREACHRCCRRHAPSCEPHHAPNSQEAHVAVKKSTGRWSGTKKSGSASAGKKTAESDRKLQREAEQRRQRTQASTPKKQGAVQSGERTYPEPPLPKQHLEKPGL